MATKDIQNRNKNNMVREERIVVGSLCALENSPKAGEEYVVCSLPAGVKLIELTGAGIGAGDVSVEVKVGKAGALFTGTLAVTDAKGATDAGPADIMTTEAVNVTVKPAVDVKYGEVFIGIKYLDYRITNSDRVDPVR